MRRSCAASKAGLVLPQGAGPTGERQVSSDDKDFAALELAARLGADYRRELADAATFPVASYAEILSRFDRPVPS